MGDRESEARRTGDRQPRTTSISASHDSRFPIPDSRRLILTADDFGLDTAVNDAVEQAHVEGALTCASLMVGAPAAEHAVAIARRLPTLGVGLHLVLADGPAVSSPDAIPDLVDAHGRFGNRMVRDGVRFFFLGNVRRQLEREIRAQFEAFTATGLVLDHVNAHKHFHLHPTVLALVLRIGRDYGLQALRLPFEQGTDRWLSPWQRAMRQRLHAAGITHNDAMHGLATTGATDEAALLAIVDRLEPGLHEVYLHPATRCGLTPAMRDYRHSDELAALVSPRLRERLAARGIVTGRWTDFSRSR